MTYSIIVHDPKSHTVGAATATGSVAVGGFVIHARFGAGAVATQGAFTNWLYGEQGLDALQQGLNAAEVRDRLVAADDGESQRQLIVCDTHGKTAGHTGRANLAHAVHQCGENVAVAGNMLADPSIPGAMMEAYVKYGHLPVHERLLMALDAGYRLGGDFRGTHSAALKVFSADRPPIDLRVDWAEQDCLGQLWQVYEKTLDPAFQGFLAGVPTLAHPTKTGHVHSDGVGS